MTQKQKILAFYFISILFIITNAIVILTKESYLINIVPIFIIVLFTIFFALDKALLIAVFLVPLSVPLRLFMPDIGFNIDLPTEPLFVGILLVFLLKQLIDRDFDKQILKHPVSISIYFYLSWRLVTVATSTIPIVSIKYWVASLWFIIPFFFLMTQVFRKKQNINTFFLLYIIPLVVVITYTMIRHAGYSFSQKSAAFVVEPFYKDHTSYGAILAMFIPIVIGFLFNKELKKNLRIISGIVLGYLLVAIVLSYTRAAWISLVGALLVYLVIKFRINIKIIFVAVVVLFVMFFSFQDKIFMTLERNKQDSSTDFKEHLHSISNVATDASNLERINRWKCAIRMYKEKPIFGWGPGTYQFEYAPFQFSYEKTIISTNAGDMGNAHSEYLGALSETGLPGMISFIIMVAVILITGIRNYYKANNYTIKIFLASTICGLTTYLLHAFLNNFLDMDKVAVPFWGFAAIIVAIDVYHLKNNKTEGSKE